MNDVPVTAPTPPSIVRLNVGEPVTDQLSLVDCPLARFGDAALKLLMAGAVPAVMATVAVAFPNEFVAVSVYVVLAAGFTVTEVPVTVPTPGLMLRVGEPVATQFKVVDCPATRIADAAVKLVIAGGEPTLMVTVADAVPEALVAVSV